MFFPLILDKIQFLKRGVLQWYIIQVDFSYTSFS